MNTPAKTATAGAPPGAPLLKRVRGQNPAEESAPKTYSGLAIPIPELRAYIPPSHDEAIVLAYEAAGGADEAAGGADEAAGGADAAVCRIVFDNDDEDEDPANCTLKTRFDLPACRSELDLIDLVSNNKPSVKAVRALLDGLSKVDTTEYPYEDLHGQSADTRFLFYRASDKSVADVDAVVAYVAVCVIEGSYDEYLDSLGEEYVDLINTYRNEYLARMLTPMA